jgi:hypothetical protein
MSTTCVVDYFACQRHPLPGGALERAVMETVWQLGEVMAREVHDRVGVPNQLAYTTIAKVLDRLVRSCSMSWRASSPRGERPAMDREVLWLPGVLR